MNSKKIQVSWPLILLALGLGLGLGLASTTSHAASLERILMPGPVSEAHATLENDCESCHSPLTETKQRTLCLDCHAEVAIDISAATGFHGKDPQVSSDQCQSCHREHKGRTSTTLAFDLTTFDHNQTDFPLHWAHAEAPCATCHVESEGQRLKYSTAPTQCSTCHKKDDTHQGTLGTQCASCHSVREWTPALFDHSTTAFPLTGSHATTACATCHTSEDFAATPTQCSSCHSQDDVHKSSFGNSCQNCHSTENWQQSQFSHLQHTKFPLTGRHTDLGCIACHKPGQPVSSNQGGTCQSCHAKDDTHLGNNGNQCQSCHNTTTWQTSTFNHDSATGFALHGAHQTLSCNQCHQGAVTEAIGNTCGECHNPDPHAGQLGGDCQQCHNESDWQKNLSFSHELTNFPLLGVHAEQACSSCHANSRFQDTEAQCVSCHQKDDVHQQSMGNECGSCHNPATWTAQRFDHAQVSGFALIGQHASLTCATCHQNETQMQARGPDECQSCHQQDDPHQNRFGSNCVQCHNNQSFREIKRL